jgi:hypothetical protein
VLSLGCSALCLEPWAIRWTVRVTKDVCEMTCGRAGVAKIQDQVTPGPDEFTWEEFYAKTKKRKKEHLRGRALQGSVNSVRFPP